MFAGNLLVCGFDELDVFSVAVGSQLYSGAFLSGLMLEMVTLKEP